MLAPSLDADISCFGGSRVAPGAWGLCLCALLGRTLVGAKFRVALSSVE